MSDAPAAPAVSKPSWTLRILIAVALTAAVVAAWLVLSGRAAAAGAAALTGGLALVAAASTVSARTDARAGTFAVSIAGRVFDALVLGAVVWQTRETNARASAAALVALGASFLAAYVRSRGRALGFPVAADQSVARAAFLGLIAAGLFFAADEWLAPALATAAAVAVLSGVMGAIQVGAAARKERG